MVATRRAARRSESEAGSHDSPAEAEPTKVEDNTSVRATRSRSKMHSPSKVIPESHPEKMKESETKTAVEEPSETQATLNRSKAVCLADSVAELQADGDISEAESNCSSVSGLQTPLFIRITRRRRIVVPCQPESASKNRQSKKTVPNERSKCQDDDDISEAESCSSIISGVRSPSVARRPTSRQVKTNVLPLCETQAEEVSDAESWCSGVSTEASVQFKRITRSMRVRSQPEATLQIEKKIEMVGDQKSAESATKSQIIVISDSEPSKSDVDTEQASSLSPAQSNDHSSPCKTKCHSESIASSDLKQTLSRSPEKIRECTKKSPQKETPKNMNYESVDSVEVKVGKDKNIRESVTKHISDDVYEIVESTVEVCDQTSEESRKVTEKQSPVKNADMSPYGHRRLEQSNMSPRQTTPNKSKNSVEPQKRDTGKFTQGCFHHTEEVIDVDEISKTGSQQDDILPIQTIESSDDDCRVSVASMESDRSHQEPVAEISSCVTKTSGGEKCFTVSLLASDESDESSDSDLEDANDLEVTASYPSTSNQNTLALDKSHSKELFVIDKTPGLDSNNVYYLEKDTVDDNESEKSEESSELEDNEVEFIDEDEDLLNANSKILSFSSSIDPGLNVKHLGGLYISFHAGKQKPGLHGTASPKEKKKDELLQKSIITPDFEKKECIPPLRESVHQLKKQRRAEREKTTGDGWFGMKAPEMTDELKNDLRALKMRAAIDPKRFYKKNDREGLPKYFQVGTVEDSPVDFYHARIPKKDRKKNIVDELLADSEFRRYNKRKYQSIMAEKAALAAGKKNLKKKKFRK
ncbi:deoxynucleotidyltransferase terminal-interacting protein 2 isoform X2 [Hemicordylus capensis]|uniref:deoxynucleotidyltransferase terminal-interacting protein 2 isoform X2 n=1 Tax=Hemicordylus capensis TaxID=884348 RepID=UPI0023038B5D|nr:deoxynucleotidyltransferase terminal-interacting protein 2 isoform X2 [Hemicordylus capensis]